LHTCGWNSERGMGMRRYKVGVCSALAVLAAIAVPFSGALAAGGMGAQEKAALASFEAMLEGLGKRDKAAMLATFLPGGTATLMRKDKPVQLTLESLADKISKSGTDPIEERIHDALVRVDGNVAIVWAPFELLENGKVEHCGRDVANLVRVEGRWLIAAIVDNSHDDCRKK